jgi:acyl-CoA reductase-like NAD-dependent aldehyde dehydrogenase
MVTQDTQVRRYRHLIGGEWVDASSGETIHRNNPATGETVAEFAAGTLEDTREAIEAARAAFDKGPWPRMPGAERGRSSTNWPSGCAKWERNSPASR